MKMYYNHTTYDFCSPSCVQCIYYQGRGWCSLFPDFRYFMGKQLHPIEKLDVFEL